MQNKLHKDGGVKDANVQCVLVTNATGVLNRKGSLPACLIQLKETRFAGSPNREYAERYLRRLGHREKTLSLFPRSFFRGGGTLTD